MAGALGPAAAAAGDFSGPVRFADSVLAARNHTGAACPCQGEWLGHPGPTPCFSGLCVCVLLPHLFLPLLGSSRALTFCLSFRLMVTAGPIRLWALGVLSWGTPMLPSSCIMVWSQRLQAPYLLACSPFSCWIPRSLMPHCGLVSLTTFPRMPRGQALGEPHLPVPHCLYLLAKPCLHAMSLSVSVAHRVHIHPFLSSAWTWTLALPLYPALTDHRAALWVRPPPAT